MKKLQLRVDTLQVSTFAIGDTGAAARGTVHGKDEMAPTNAETCVTCTRRTDPCLCFPTPVK